MYLDWRAMHPRRAFKTLAGWASQHRYEILSVALITSVGAALRLYRLDAIPVGLHGDEATNGLMARLILDGDWAGPYDASAMGRPAGFLYWLAAFIAVFSDTTFTVRFAAATLAILTLPCAYLLFRAIDGRATAVIGSSLLAVSGWHLVYSRLGWEQSLLVLLQVIAAFFLILATRTEKRWLFGVAGVALGFGIYSHNSYPYFLIAVGIWLTIWLATKWTDFPQALVGPATMAGTFLLTALPMLSYIRNHQNDYLRRSRAESIFNSEQFESASFPFGQLDVLFEAARRYVELVMLEGPIELPSIALPIAVLLGLGMVLAIWRWRQPAVILAAIMVLVLPLPGILLVSGSEVDLRRTVGVTPFIALVAAMPLAAALRSQWLTHPALRLAAVSAVAAVIVYAGVTDRSYYFDEFRSRQLQNYDITVASRFMSELSANQYVYLFSMRRGYEFEVRRFLAPDTEGEDRSGAWGSVFDIAPDRDRDVMYIFMDRFLDVRDVVAALYPGGQSLDHWGDDEFLLFRSYELPREVNVAPAE